MPRAYWIVHLTVSDPDAYAAYRQAVPDVLAGYGGRFLVRAAPQEVVEGEMRPRTIVLEFPDLAQARACYASAEYQAVKALRDPVATADLCIIEGYDP